MKLLHIVAGLPPEGGISQSVPELCRHLVAEDLGGTLVTTGGAISQAAMQAQESGVDLVLCQPSWPAQLYFSIEMLRKLPALIKAADVVHVHSQWTFPIWWGCHLALKHKKPLIMTPRGCLAPERLKISAFKKRLVGWLFDRRYLRRASVIHATCEREAEAINKFMASASHELKWLKWLKWLKGSHASLPLIVVIPNGIDLATFDAVAADRGSVDARWPECRGRRMVLFLSRIHPIKGLESLIAAWVELSKLSTFNLQPSTPAVSRGWVLLIAGSGDERYVAGLRQQVTDAGLNESIKFVGPVFGAEKIRLMKAAGLFVLPTKNENFGIVVAESLACSVPVITTKGAPWQELAEEVLKFESSKVLKFGQFENTEVPELEDLEGTTQCPNLGETIPTDALTNSRTNALMNFPTNELTNFPTNALLQSGWWVDIGVEPLAEALREALALSDAERRAMGQNGRKLVEAKYQWSAVEKQMAAVYADIAPAEQWQ